MSKQATSEFRETLIQLRHDLKKVNEPGTITSVLDTLLWQLQQREEERLRSAGGSR